MSERVRNIAVGITVLVALALLGGMVLIFAGMPSLFKGGYVLRIHLDASYDLAAGDSVYLSGIRVGTITDVGFANLQAPGEGIVVTAKIDPDIRLPGNSKAVVYTRGFTGKGYLQLNPEGPYPVDQQGHLVAFLPADGSAYLVGENLGSGLIPDEFRAALRNVADLAGNLNRLIAPTPTTAAATGAASQAAPARTSLSDTVAKLNRALDSITQVVGDPQNQQNIRSGLVNLSQAAQQASAAMESLKAFAEQARQTAANSSGQIDTLMQRLIADAEGLARLMATLNQTAMKIDQGQGTAGKLLNDPQLYNNLSEATAQLNRLVLQMQLLIESWQKEGVGVKVR
jgi:phospholipid/cholesterol/gamma-HCH transport system substrate-binding protein